LTIALKSKERHNALLAAGLTSMILLQAIFNFFVVMGLAPTKGVTLPFMSYGGSSLLTSAIMIGILLRLNLESEVPEGSEES
jgi:cell division protein FtsW